MPSPPADVMNRWRNGFAIAFELVSSVAAFADQRRHEFDRAHLEAELEEIDRRTLAPSDTQVGLRAGRG